LLQSRDADRIAPAGSSSEARPGRLHPTDHGAASLKI
jgi:hypothetical protein